MKPNCTLMFFMLLAVITSCSIEKRVHQPGFYIDFNSTAKTHSNKNTALQSKQIAEQPTFENSANQTTSDIEGGVISAGISEPIMLPTSNEIIFNQQIGSTNDCDLMIFKNGEELMVKVTEVLPDEIKYKRCDNLNGPLYTSKKYEVFMVKYANGVKDVFNRQEPPQQPANARPAEKSTPSTTNNEPRGAEPFGLFGFFFSIFGLIFAGIILGSIGIIFGAVSLGKISKRPERFSGAGFAVFSIIIGIISVVGAIVALNTIF